ncbi:hypothetical protein Gain_1053_001 [Komagataeibacter intermedius TF2]|nr:hypothetical protein Gain_1053_001 [Komagataeibacter intermedius TF2]
MKVNDFLDFPVPEPKYKIPITKSAEEPGIDPARCYFRYSYAGGQEGDLSFLFFDAAVLARNL